MIIKFLLNATIFFCSTLFLTTNAFSSEETLEALRLKEEKILKSLNKKYSLGKELNLSNSKEIDNLIDKLEKEALNNDIDKIYNKKTYNDKTYNEASVKIKNDSQLRKLFTKRVAKRRDLRKKISLRRTRDDKLKDDKLSSSTILASNIKNKIGKNKIDTDLNDCIKKADLVLEKSKSDSSKRTISKEYFTITDDYFAESERDDGTSFVYVADDVSLHTLPSLSSKLIYLVKANTKLKLDKNHGAWYRVKSADNKYGWILGDMLHFSDPSSLSTLKNKGKGL
ncbi:MAG: SH3 domain-containing protein [Bdellovibrionota bacterium]